MIRKYTLLFDEKSNSWKLKNDHSNLTIRTFASREDAMKGGALKKALGLEGGSVKIRTREGVFREERSYPAAASRR